MALPTGQALDDLADAVFSALERRYEDPLRLHLYLANCALDHGRKALEAHAAMDDTAARAHLLAYRRIRDGLIQDGYWDADAARQVSIG